MTRIRPMRDADATRYERIGYVEVKVSDVFEKRLV